MGWSGNSIDRFILAKIEAQGGQPAPAADRRTLLRRATFDLTGLPPTPEEIDAFAADSSPDEATAGDDKEDILARLLPKPAREALAQSIKLVQGFGFVKANGEIYKTRSDLRGAPQYAALFSKFSNDAMEALQNASIPLPNGKVKPLQKWTGTDKIVRFAIGYAAEEPKGANTPPPADEGGIPGTGPGRKVRKVNEYKYVEQLTYTYLGTRTRIGQKEAVIRIEGVIKPAPGSSVAGGANGLLKGYAYIDLDTGTVLESELHREFEMDSSSDGVKKMVSGVNNYKVTRGTASGQ